MKLFERPALRAMTRGLWLTLFLVGALHSGWAQPQPSGAASAANKAATTKQDIKDASAKSATALDDTRYRIGPGDVLDVRVARAPELSRDAVRVDQGGMIRMPMLDNDIQAACLTEGEVAANIAKLYLKYKNEPHV